MKTGMLATSATVGRISDFVSRNGIANLVVDPVLISTSGTPLAEEGMIDAVVRRLLPLSTLVTPNLAEAEALTGATVRDLASMENAARRLCAMGAGAALVKGGHLAGDAVDVLFDGKRIQHFRAPRIPAPNNHGTGCVLSAAIAARLALGDTLTESIRTAKESVAHMLQKRNGPAS
jgi:hydroxymethylpyrimidine/phosphomethylpyrimidine kinase